MASCKNQDLLLVQGVNLKILNLKLFVSQNYTFVYSNYLESYRIYANSPQCLAAKGVILMSWNDFFQLLIAVSNILLAIKAFSNDDNKRKAPEPALAQ